MPVNIVDLLPLPAEVDLGRGKLQLRGLDLEALSRLLATHRDTAMAFISAGAVTFDALVLTAPHFVADVIAYSADAIDQRDAVMKIPVATQLECISKIYTLTVPDEKKFKALLEGLAEKLQQANLQLASPQPTQQTN